MKFDKIAVFCGSSATIDEKYNLPMETTGGLLAENNSALVFGIGDEGLMGAVFRGARAKGGYVIGVTTQRLLDLQCKNIHEFDNNAEIVIVDNLNIRKMKMIEDSDAILIGPGGWGTYDEYSEMAVQVQIGGVKRKPMIFLNFDGFWNPIKEHIGKMMQEGFINDFKNNFIEFVDAPEDVYPALEKLQEKINTFEAQL